MEYPKTATSLAEVRVLITRWRNKIKSFVKKCWILCWKWRYAQCPVMGHYQEDGIGVKGFTSDRGSIPKESPEGIAFLVHLRLNENTV